MNALAKHAWGESRGADRVWSQVAGMRPSQGPGRKLMVLQAFIDESVDDSGVLVLAGYIASAEEWAAFSREWEKMLPAGTLNDRGEYHFKMSEMALSPERMSRLPGFHTIINKHVRLSVACAIREADIQRAASRLRFAEAPAVKLQHLTDPWFLCFLFLMNTFHKERALHPELFNLDEPVDFYFDDTSVKHAVLDSWSTYLEWRPPEYRDLYGATPRFEDDQVFLPLQAADFRAWWVRKWVVEHGIFEAGEKASYPYVSAAKKILNVYCAGSEDDIVALYSQALRNDFGEDLELLDRGPLIPSPDGPAPLQRLGSFLVRSVKQLFSRRTT